MNTAGVVNPVQRSCMRDKIRDAIVTRILDGSYAPGVRLIELNLAREFNVSQAPVREALRELEAHGLVESERYRGTRVRSADARDLREIYQLRAALEEHAAQLAVPVAPEALATLAAILENMHATAAAGDIGHYARLAISFHRMVVELSGNRLFLKSWDGLHLDVPARIASFYVGDRIRDYADAHDAILQALRDSKGNEAGRLLRELIQRLVTMFPEKTEAATQLP
jgi:DNA-binding GntR family transcriptional regulator